MIRMYAVPDLVGVVVRVIADVENVRGDDLFQIRIVPRDTGGKFRTVVSCYGKEEAFELKAHLPVILREIMDDLIAIPAIFGHRRVKVPEVETSWEDLIIPDWAKPMP